MHVAHHRKTVKKIDVWMVLLLCLAVLSSVSKFDLYLAGIWYKLEGNAWTLRDNFFTYSLFHEGGRSLIMLLGLSNIVSLISSCFCPRLRLWKKPLLFVFLSSLTTILFVALLKKITHMDCPWSLKLFGGENPYIGLFESHPGTFPCGHCFPAGHASGALAWFGLYFLAVIRFPKHSIKIFAVVLITGLSFGFAQQLRGAHFLSHDLFSVVISWLIARLWFLWIFKKAST
jgi:membrane-associated PAP2 superfamily phosphatase